MKKKIISMFLAAAMILSLVACGSSNTTKSEGSSEAGSKKTLKVAMECGYAPYNWTQSDDSNGAVPIKDSSDYAYGYDVMMAKKIADELGYDLQIVKLDWDSLIPAVQSGQVDCVIAGQSITSERKQMESAIADAEKKAKDYLENLKKQHEENSKIHIDITLG